MTSSNSSSKDAQRSDPTQMKRRFGWCGLISLVLGLAFLGGAGVSVLAVYLMNERGVTGDDVSFAWVLAGASTLIGGLIIAAAFKRRDYVDETGTVLPYVIMAQMIGNDSFDFTDDAGGID